jgi:hypothetical protein
MGLGLRDAAVVINGGSKGMARACLACPAGIRRQAIAIHLPHAGPASLVSRLVPPIPASTPRLRTSGTPNSASGVQNRKSHDTAISTPAPEAAALRGNDNRLPEPVRTRPLPLRCPACTTGHSRPCVCMSCGTQLGLRRSANARHPSRASGPYRLRSMVIRS